MCHMDDKAISSPFSSKYVRNCSMKPIGQEFKSIIWQNSSAVTATRVSVFLLLWIRQTRCWNGVLPTTYWCPFWHFYMFSCSLLMGSYSIPEQTSPIKHFCLSEVQQFQISVPVSVSVQLWTKPSPSLPTYQYRSFSLSNTGIGICPQIKYWLGSI